ncbi:MAG TPA: alanine dehydrogenase, partial [Myxococcota bacterium]|nr:alanine dehydrogenase [Myxococcota bacterium]
MQIGVPRETKDMEFRVGMTPDGAKILVEDGHQVLIEQNAGVGSGFPDGAYQAVGAKIVETEE